MSRVRRVRSPDGRTWEVRVVRFRLPRLRQPDTPSDLADEFGAVGVVLELVVTLVAGILVPLVVAALELPVAFARSLFDSGRWVEAVCGWPGEIRITWRVADKARARKIADVLAERLSAGYDELEADGAVLVEVTPPPGLDDLRS